VTTAPRAVTSDTEELAATISVLKSRLNELETASGSGNAPIGTIVDYIGTNAPTSWTVLDGSTITNGAILYPNLWAILPASFKSGNDIVKPDTRGRVTVHQSSAGTLAGVVGSTGGLERVTLDSTEMPVHAHTITHDHPMAHDHPMPHTHTNRT
jgi:microcystin-dependent protein